MGGKESKMPPSPPPAPEKTPIEKDEDEKEKIKMAVEIDSKGDRDAFVSTRDITFKDSLISEMRVSSVNVEHGYDSSTAIIYTIGCHRDNITIMDNVSYILTSYPPGDAISIDSNGCTLLHIAVINNKSEEVFKLLIDFNGDTRDIKY